MPLTREVEFLAVDEIQLCADPERGHVFTHRLLHARGAATRPCCWAPATMAPLIRRLLPGAEIVTRERFSQPDLRRAEEAHPPAAPHRRRRLLGRRGLRHRRADPPPARRRGGGDGLAQPPHPQRPGGALPVRRGRLPGGHRRHRHGPEHGRRPRGLRRACASSTASARGRCYPQEIGQIAGRAGRFRRDGTFGVTGDCRADGRRPGRRRSRSTASSRSRGAEWRNAGSISTRWPTCCARSPRPPPRAGLKPSEEALDETTLRAAGRRRRTSPTAARDRSALFRLWDACQTPDFRKTTLEDHVRLAQAPSSST